ncbi:fic family toxin-antitoxin system, toxin component [Streptomyces sp. NPDC058595]|uniref:fic family toxin-antitoxin system, toxin component n=1 Tax=Streptomyces sp. NPDC058595 TaxID=3346550 RepID=UPI00364DD58B
MLTVDLRWLLRIAQEHLPGDPDIVDYGALEAARARHCAVVMDTTVYDGPYVRAAALMQSLIRLPALEHSNELYATAVAAAFLRASGRAVKISTDQAADLVDQIKGTEVPVRDIATALRTWAPSN